MWRGIPIVIFLYACTAFGTTAADPTSNEPNDAGGRPLDAGADGSGGDATLPPTNDDGDGGPPGFCAPTTPPFDDFESSPTLDGWTLLNDFHDASAVYTNTDKYCGQSSFFVSAPNGDTPVAIQQLKETTPGPNHVIMSLLVQVMSMSETGNVEFAKLLAANAHFYFEFRGHELDFTERNEDTSEEDVKLLVSAGDVVLGQWEELYVDLTLGKTPSAARLWVGPPGGPPPLPTKPPPPVPFKYDSGGGLTGESLGVTATGGSPDFVAYFDRYQLVRQ